MPAKLNHVVLALTAAGWLYAALWAGGGLVFSGPLGALGVGLIGLGMCVSAHQARNTPRS